MLTRGSAISLLTWLLIACSAPSSGAARSWRVSKVGTGDFSKIQPALDAAAPGDTVLIAPGRYTETTLFQADCCQALPTYAGIAKENLTIIGAHRDSVLIGPDAVMPGEIGILMRYDFATGLRVRDLTLRYLDEGVRATDYAEVSNLRIADCWTGALAVSDSGLAVRECSFEGYEVLGLLATLGARNVVVDSCHFTDTNNGAMQFFASYRPIVRNTVVLGGTGGMSFSQEGTHGLMQSCTVSGVTGGAVGVGSGASLELYDCHLEGGARVLVTFGAEFVSGSRNVIGGASRAVLEFRSGGTAKLSGNSFTRGDSLLVLLVDYPQDIFGRTLIDLRDNAWGTTDDATIQALIWDGSDDPAVHAVVQYRPIMTEALPARNQSVGRLKRLFGAKGQ